MASWNATATGHCSTWPQGRFPNEDPSNTRCSDPCRITAGLDADRALGDRQDPDAIAELRRAEQGDAEAQYQLGLRHAIGLGVPTDNAESIRWYRLALSRATPTRRSSSRAGTPSD